ncbi:MAG TPA: lysophospholipid acyltransferase family protein [Candidatus Dormibacteraeota bacterium]|nr:lysophospholipid acyltransferase family protein [Candidatus Dormibacteraeota bacterium]
MSRAGSALRWAAEDTLRVLREWRPPERPEPVERVPRAARPPRAAEPTWGRSDTSATARRAIQRTALFPLLDLLGRPTVVGLHHLQAARPPLILAPNHASHADAPLVLRALPPALRDNTLVPAAADYFFNKRWLSVAVTLSMNAVPFDRRSDIADSVRRLERLLRHGHSIVLFPEGSRARDGRLRGFKAGVAHLATQTGAPVIPVYVQGTHALLPAGAALPRPSAVAVHFGTAMVARPEETARAFNERLEVAVGELMTAARGHGYRDAAPRRPGWREVWRPEGALSPDPQPELPDPSEGWIARWRSTTPR